MRMAHCGSEAVSVESRGTALYRCWIQVVPAAVFGLFFSSSSLVHRRFESLRQFSHSGLVQSSMLRRVRGFVGVVLTATFAISLGLSEVGAACVVEGGSTEKREAGLVLHLSPTCTQAEREAHVVYGEKIMDALGRGSQVDLVGVIVQGDVLFDRLAPQAMVGSSVASDLPSQSEPALSQEERLVRAGLRIRDSVVWGAVRHRSVSSSLRFEGPVDFQGSRFREGVDLSRSIFREAVELSGAAFEKDAHFVQGEFVGPLACRETAFGPSTRFHRSTFRSSVDCTGARFDGMAEFLEVMYEQPVEFERARFGLGTGFSGSHFKSRLSFRDAIFSRETFFTFTVFEEETMFAGAQFLGAVDFSHAEFRQHDDLAQARFDHPPLLVQAKRREPPQPDSFLQTKNGQYALTFGLLVTAALLVAYAIRLK